MFNEMSDDQMRRTMLETLMREDENKEEVDVLTNNDEINELIARTDDEREFYTKIDEQQLKEQTERYQQMGKKPPSRLMAFEELPDWMNVEISQTNLEDELPDYGRGKRNKEEKFYGDLTDNQFDKLLEGRKANAKRTSVLSTEKILDHTAGKRRKNEKQVIEDEEPKKRKEQGAKKRGPQVSFFQIVDLSESNHF